MSIRKFGLFSMVVIMAGALIVLTGCKTEEIEPIAKTQGAAEAMGLNILQVADREGDFKTFVRLADQVGLRDTLSAAGPYTVFAPTDNAFAKLPAGTLEDLQKPENHGKLRDILSYHVVQGRVSAADISKQETLRSLNGQELKIQTIGSNVLVDNANITKTDVFASNGIIHPIDTVLMPR